jgi:hypothetical protein
MNFYKDQDGDYWFGDGTDVICVGSSPKDIQNAAENGDNYVLGDLLLQVVPFDASDDLHGLELLVSDTGD